MALMLKSASWLLVGAALFGAQREAAAADAFPSRPIRMIVPSGAGGITDILARVIAVRLSENLGHQVVVDNRGARAAWWVPTSSPKRRRTDTRC